MPRLLVAGATGYLGKYLLMEAKRRGHAVRALTRSERRLTDVCSAVDEVFVGEATQPSTLDGIARGVEVVVSALGITRQKDGLRYVDVDYRGNLHLLEQALRSGARKFVYVSLLKADELRELRIVQAKERFVDELRGSGIDYAVIRPNGYFSDMLAFLDMARRGRVFLFGRGDFRINPISGEDVAARCLDAIDLDDPELSFGGPLTFSHREIAHAAFAALGRPPRVTCFPVALAKTGLWLVRRITPESVYGPLEFTLTVTTRDLIGPPTGTRDLREFFRDQVTRSDS